MVWTLDMDDFNGEFCRKNKKDLSQKFPLINAIKREFEIDEITTQISTLSIETTTLSNQTDDLFNELFLFASSSSSKLFQTYFILTSSYLIRSTINIIT
jgi:hypothetical protein